MPTEIGPESEPANKSIEEWALELFGYQGLEDKEITAPDGRVVLVRNFLDTYPTNSPHRQLTEDLFEGFRSMKPGEEFYADTYNAIAAAMRQRLGPPPGENTA